jgi:hypothetical protein
MTCKSTRSFSLPLRFAITLVVEEKKKGISNQATCSTTSLIHGDAGSTTPLRLRLQPLEHHEEEEDHQKPPAWPSSDELLQTNGIEPTTQHKATT